MVVQLKIRKVGNSLGVVLPKEVLSRLNSGEGDTLILSDTPDGGFRVTPNAAESARQMEAAGRIAKRYGNALRELAK